ncbi:Rpn family recombination-promoting nuclease/putative transposase [Nocardia tenerifensis]|nr:Rpn family recombination-promoting nuclease/putative transposase [Nocardia tenerifensis]
MSDAPNNPHDTYFRRVLTRSSDAVCAIRGAVPDNLAELVDWSVMELLSCSFISRELRSRYTDILYRTRMAGREAYIYVLVEHQSSVDRMMALRMLGYLVDIWRYYLRQNPKARTLPPVIPVVVHNNSTGCAWSAETEVYDLIDVEEPARSAMDPWLPRLRFLLDDVATMDMEALRARKLTPATLVMLVLQQIAPGNSHLEADMKPLLEDVRAMQEQPGGIDDLITMFTYIITVGETTAESLESLTDQLGPRAKEAAMTTADQLRAEGEARGRAEGEARGRAEVLLELLASRFGSVPRRIVDAVCNADQEQMRLWSRRILTAGSLDEIFGV